MEITSLIMENHGKIMESCFLISVGIPKFNSLVLLLSIFATD